jgi:hypothetical protein
MSIAAASNGTPSVSIFAFPGLVDDRRAKDWQAAGLIPVSRFAQHVRQLRRQYRIIPLCEVAEWLAEGGNGPAAAIVLLEGLRSIRLLGGTVLGSVDVPAAVMVSSAQIDGTQQPVRHTLLAAITAAASAGRRRMDTPIGPRPVHKPDHAQRTYLALREWMDRRSWATADAAVQHLANRYGLAELPDYLQPMSWSDVREMQDRGLEIGVHDQPDRLLQSVQRVQQETGCRSIPLSHAESRNGLHHADLKQAGCYCALVPEARPVTRDDDRYHWPRIAIAAKIVAGHDDGVRRGGLWRTLTRSFGLNRAAASLP